MTFLKEYYCHYDYIPSQIFLYLLSFYGYFNGGGGEGTEQNHQMPHWVGRGPKINPNVSLTI